MNKLEMAHHWALKNMYNPKYNNMTAGEFAKKSFEYAEAMEAESKKREDTSRPDVFNEDWQPDWSQAPDGFDWWFASADKNGACSGGFFCSVEPEASLSLYSKASCWITRSGSLVESSSFGYQGNWQDSLRKRP